MGQNINVRAHLDSDRYRRGDIIFWKSKVRVKYGWWAKFPHWTGTGDDDVANAFIDDGESFTGTYELRGRGAAKRRYQFHIAVRDPVSGQGSFNEFHTVWFPSNTGYTTATTIDLGNLDDYF